MAIIGKPLDAPKETKKTSTQPEVIGGLLVKNALSGRSIYKDWTVRSVRNDAGEIVDRYFPDPKKYSVNGVNRLTVRVATYHGLDRISGYSDRI